MGIKDIGKKLKSLSVNSIKSIGFPTGRRSPSLESTQSLTQGGSVPLPPTGLDERFVSPEGGIPPEAYGQSLYDCISFVIYCPKHKKIAIARGDQGKALWLPFVVLKTSDTWINAAIGGMSFILSHGDLQKFAAMPEVPFTPPKIVHILRLQQAQVPRFVSRVTYAAKVTREWATWKCCEDDRRIVWCPAEEVLKGNLDRVWGPEPYMLCKHVFEENLTLKQELTEFSVDDAMLFKPRDPVRNKEEDLMKSALYLEKEIINIYADFSSHCYPSHYMSYTSFVEYMAKVGWSQNDVRLIAIFRAFNYRANGYLCFWELLLGLAAMDPATNHGGQPGELRCGYIFRYYDVNNDGLLDFADIIRMSKDIATIKETDLNDKIIEKDAVVKMESLGLKRSSNIQFPAFIEAVANLKFRGTSVLFRSPIATTKQISRRQRIESFGVAGAPKASRRRAIGTCPTCRQKKYKIGLHRVQLDFTGRVIDPKPLLETEGKDIIFRTEDALTEQLRSYSRETVFNTTAGPNNVLDILRQFDKTYAQRAKANNPDLKDWRATDRNVLLNTITALCRQAEEIFSHETRCVKVNSPCYVLGDIHGNMADLMTYERTLWKCGPTVSSASFLFLGDYVDRGDYGVEAVCYLVALKILAPDKFFFCRGNHEIRSIQKVFTFLKECMKKYGTRIGPQVFETMNKVFDRMPICGLVDETVYGAHGGIPTSVNKIADLMRIPSPLQEPEGESPAAWEIMWNDPMNVNEFNELAEFMKIKTESVKGFLSNSKRGTAFFYTEEAVNNFMETNGLTHVLRGHEVMPLGFKFHCGGKVCTIFSSSNYCGGTNQAATMYLDGERMRVIRLETSGDSIV